MINAVIYPGRFDPVTIGHMHIIERACRLFPKVYVAVSSKGSVKSWFDVHDRVRMMTKACQHISNVTVGSFDGMLFNHCSEWGVNTIIRGIRHVEDWTIEQSMANMNAQLDPKLETIFLSSRSDVSHVNATLVREILMIGGDVSAFVPSIVLDDMKMQAEEPV